MSEVRRDGTGLRFCGFPTNTVSFADTPVAECELAQQSPPLRISDQLQEAGRRPLTRLGNHITNLHQTGLMDQGSVWRCARSSPPHRSRARGVAPDDRRPVQRRDRGPALRQQEDGERSRLEHPAQARSHEPDRSDGVSPSSSGLTTRVGVVLHSRSKDPPAPLVVVHEAGELAE